MIGELWLMEPDESLTNYLIRSHGHLVRQGEVALNLTHSVFRESDGRNFVKHIVSDDDSSIRTHIQH